MKPEAWKIKPRKCTPGPPQQKKTTKNSHPLLCEPAPQLGTERDPSVSRRGKDLHMRVLVSKSEATRNEQTRTALDTDVPRNKYYQDTPYARDSYGQSETKTASTPTRTARRILPESRRTHTQIAAPPYSPHSQYLRSPTDPRRRRRARRGRVCLPRTACVSRAENNTKNNLRSSYFLNGKDAVFNPPPTE
jgi:hypothetical protein